MSAVTADELLAVLETGEFDRVAGVVEDGAIDFKSAPHQLGLETAKFELAKDVAAFASSTGPSVIVFPVETEQPTDSPFERAVRVRPIERARVDDAQIRAVIRSHVFPSPRDVEVRFFPSPEDAKRCVVAIFIPPQREIDKPFLVIASLAGNASKVQGWLFGLPTRALDETEQMRASELHELISRGRNVASRLEEIASLVAHGAVAAAPTADPVEAATLAAEAATAMFASEDDAQGGRSQLPTLFLAATPSTATSVPSILQVDGVRGLLERPPHTRHDGWNLLTLNQAELVEGTRLRVTSGRRKLIELAENGTLVAVAPILALLTREKLNVPDGAREIFKLNPLGVIEFTHDFVLVYQALAQDFEPLPERAHFVVGLRGITGSTAGDIALAPHSLNSIGYQTAEIPYDMQLPDSPTFTWSFESPLDAEPGVVAHALVERIYAYFKHTTDAIPYLNDERTAVDPGKFGQG
jgi:hypothetical protein